MNSFQMKWVYEGVAKSQEARLSDCFVNSISLKLRLILTIYLLFPFIFGGVGVKLGTVLHCFISTLSFNVRRNDHITSSLSGIFLS